MSDDLGSEIAALPRPASDTDLSALGALLADAVASGAAVSFVAPFPTEAATDWWRTSLAGAHPKTVVLVARDAQGIAGCVRLDPAWAPNQPHRAEVTKLLVHRRARRRGLGRRLMEAVEDAARRAGFALLTLDAKRGADAERLYVSLGWVLVGTIPRFALDPDGAALHDDVIYFRELGAPPGPAGARAAARADPRGCDAAARGFQRDSS